MASKLHVLIVGGGPAGCTAAFWLAKGGAKVTVVERSTAEFPYGQGIDVEGTARQIIQRMGVFEEMKAKGTGEKGFALVDDDGKPVGVFEGQSASLTSDIEIMRGDLCKILAGAAKKLDGVVFQYGRTVTDLTQDEDGIAVVYDNGENARFQAVVGADGSRSRTRELALPKAVYDGAFKPWDNYCAYFDLPQEEGDMPNSRCQQCQNARFCFVRPVNKLKSSGYLAVRQRSEALNQSLKEGKLAQKQALFQVFAGVGGLVPRVMEQMMDADNFYFEQLGQVKLSKWSEGRFAVVGDAGYAPSPLTGQGTQLGICGAYYLAGELIDRPDNPNAAFEAYERRFRPIVEEAQKLPLGGLAPAIANPTSGLVVWFSRTLFKLLAASGLYKKLGMRRETPPPPTYEKLEGESP